MRRVYRPIATLLAALGLLMVIVTFTPLTAWWARIFAGPWNDPRGEVLIVLGGSGANPDGIISLNSYWRTVYAARIWREGGVQAIIVAGGSNAATSMRDYLVSQGVPLAIIQTETESGNTHENATRVRDLVNGMPGRKILLTSDFHMYRAHRAFEAAGVPVEPRPIPDVLKRYGTIQARWSAFNDLCTEAAKIIYYKSRGWI